MDMSSSDEELVGNYRRYLTVKRFKLEFEYKPCHMFIFTDNTDWFNNQKLKEEQNKARVNSNLIKVMDEKVIQPMQQITTQVREVLCSPDLDSSLFRPMRRLMRLQKMSILRLYDLVDVIQFKKRFKK